MPGARPCRQASSKRRTRASPSGPRWLVRESVWRISVALRGAGETRRPSRPLWGALKPLADALAQAADGALGPPQAGADLRGRVPLQAQLQDRPLVGVHGPEELLDRLGQDGRLPPQTLPGQRPAPQLGGVRVSCLADDVAPLGSEVRDAVGTFAERDQGEQVPQTLAVADVQLPLPVPQDKALVGRLDHVLGV